jgi:DNA-3-methyladenine glycosylase II
MQTLANDADLRAACDRLIAAEPRFARVIEVHGPPPLRRMADGLPGLLRIVTDQLISLRAGEAIWRRVEAGLAPFDARRISCMREASLMKLGLSGAKARCFRAVAKATLDGRLDFDRLYRLGDAEALAQLVAIPGIGPWTADIYLLAAMGRADAWPAGDLALQVGALHLFDLAARPGPRALAALAEAWRPHRATAARLLWSHYRGLKGMSQTVT